MTQATQSWTLTSPWKWRQAKPWALIRQLIFNWWSVTLQLQLRVLQLTGVNLSRFQISTGLQDPTTFTNVILQWTRFLSLATSAASTPRLSQKVLPLTAISSGLLIQRSSLATLSVKTQQLRWMYRSQHFLQVGGPSRWTWQSPSTRKQTRQLTKLLSFLKLQPSLWLPTMRNPQQAPL